MKGNALIACFVLLPLICMAQDSLNVSEIAQIDIWGTISDIVVAGDYAYLATEKQSVVIVDVSDPGNPTPVGRTHTYYTHAVELELADSLLIVSTGDNLWFEYGTVDIFRMMSPTELERIAVIQQHGPGARLVNHKQWLLVDDWYHDSDLYDISDPANPQFVGRVPIEGGAIVHNGLLFLLNNDWDTDQFQIRRFNPPDDFTVVGSTLREASRAIALVTAGNLAVTNDWDEVVLIDISDVTSPVEVGRYETPHEINGLCISGNVLYAVDARDAVTILDIMDPTAPRLISSISALELLHSIDVDNDLMLIGDREGCLEIYDVSATAAPRLIGGTYHYQLANLVSLRGLIVGAASYNLLGGLRRKAPNTLLRPQQAAGISYLMDAHGDHLYVDRGNEGVGILLVHDDLITEDVGHIELENTAGTIAVDGNTLCVQDNEVGLSVYDIGIPAQPSLTAFTSATAPGHTHHVMFSDGLAAYLDDWNFVSVLGIAGPVFKMLFERIEVGSLPHTITMDDSVVALAGYRLKLINLSRNGNGEVCDPFGDETVESVLLQQRRLFASDWGGISIFDLSKPKSPIKTGWYRVPLISSLNITRLHAVGDTLFAAAEFGFYAFDVSKAPGGTDFEQPEPAPQPIPESYSLSVYPNPFNPTTTISFDLTRAGRASLSVFDINGRLVRTLYNEIAAAGSHTVTFDATREASGVYFCRLQADGYTTTQKMILLK